MSEEVKEILEELKEYAKGGMNGLYPPEENISQLLNYITNLQKENENLEKLNNANYLSFIDVNKKRLKAIEYINKVVNNSNNTILPSGKVTDLGYCIPALEDLKIILDGGDE